MRQKLRNSGLEAQIENPLRTDETGEGFERLSQVHFEYVIYKLFYVDVVRLIEIKAALGKNFHIQPSEIDKMPFWEYEIYIQTLNRLVQEENDKQKAEMDRTGVTDALKNTNPKAISKMQQNMTPKTPEFKTPNFNMGSGMKF